MLAAAAAAAAAAASLPPPPPLQTAAQRAVVQHAAAAAEAAAPQGTAEALRRLGDPAFREQLGRLAPELAALSAPELLSRWDAAQDVTEVVHGFPARTDPLQNNALDLDIALAENATWFYNQWQIPVLFPEREKKAAQQVISYLAPAGAAEVGLWGCPAFTGRNPYGQGLWPGGYPSSLEEANQRAVYTAWNQHNLAFPAFAWGDVGVVFNSSALHDALILTPTDTGDYVCACYTDFTDSFCATWTSGGNASCSKFWYCTWDAAAQQCGTNTADAREHRCDAWKGTVSGVWGRTHHLVAAYADWYRGGVDSGPRRLALLLSRMLLPWARAPRMEGDWFDFFYEANIFGNPRFPQAVKFVVAWLPSLFGTPEGDRVRAWCARWGWPLLWALGPHTAYSNSSLPGPPSDGWEGKGRILDPLGLHALAHNVSMPPQAAQSFRAVWQEAAALRRSGRALSPADTGGWWDRLAAEPSLVRAEPLRPGDCATPGRCVGTDAAGTCLCY
eukprot:TRINITY_DN60608_c0_g1_i1.p2 TRINITY_DN60608_c0_g1~~TRINITY_DN60608_c0_g1_i1.p2  ORF type:complete len:524 (+),score=168.49 TRINITY_DN60608_c0_g1_i1:68-1573(+)